MKKLLFLTFGLMPACLMAQHTFTINGNVKDIKSTDKLYYYYQGDKGVKSDSLIVQNGHFQFSGTTSKPTSVILFLKDQYSQSDRFNTFTFYADGGRLNLNSKDSIKNIVVENSPINNAFEYWKNLKKPIEYKLDEMVKEYMALSDAQKADEKVKESFMNREQQYMSELTATGIQLAKKYPDSYLSLVALEQASGIPSLNADAAIAYQNLTPQLKKLELGKKIQLILSSETKSQVGKQAMDFTQNTPEGKAVKLSDYKGKYVLVDFWASWCGPCRAENPNVLAAYNKYKDHGFTVLGISFDYPGKREAWVKAINEDKLPWTQISELKGWDNLAALQYGIRSIPANILVGPDGKIVAKNLRDKILNDKLAEIFEKGTK